MYLGALWAQCCTLWFPFLHRVFSVPSAPCMLPIRAGHLHTHMCRDLARLIPPRTLPTGG